MDSEVVVAQDESASLVVADKARDLDSAFCALVEFGSVGCRGRAAVARGAGVGGDAPGCGDGVAPALTHDCGVKQEGDAAFGG